MVDVSLVVMAGDVVVEVSLVVMDGDVVIDGGIAIVLVGSFSQLFVITFFTDTLSPSVAKEIIIFAVLGN